MTAREVVIWLTDEFGSDSSAKIVVISRIADPSTGERSELPVIDLSFDDSDGEISLLVNRAPSDHETAEQLTVASLLAKLTELPPSFRSGTFVSGTWIKLDDEHDARIDWPFAQIATKDDDSCVAFVERPLAEPD